MDHSESITRGGEYFMSEWITNELNQQMANYRWANRQIAVDNRIINLEQCDGEIHENDD
jgi:hypothetical protein